METARLPGELALAAHLNSRRPPGSSSFPDWAFPHAWPCAETSHTYHVEPSQPAYVVVLSSAHSLGLERLRKLPRGTQLEFCFYYFLIKIKFISQCKVHHWNHCKAYNSVAFSAFTLLCNHQLPLVPEHFPHPKGTLSPVKQSLPVPSPSQSLATTHLCSACVDLPALDISNERSNMVCDLLCLVCSHDVFRVHRTAACIHTFLFWLPSIPLCGYHSLLIRSSAGRHWGCSHFLVTLTGAAMTLQDQLCLTTCFQFSGA